MNINNTSVFKNENLFTLLHKLRVQEMYVLFYSSIVKVNLIKLLMLTILSEIRLLNKLNDISLVLEL